MNNKKSNLGKEDMVIKLVGWGNGNLTDRCCLFAFLVRSQDTDDDDADPDEGDGDDGDEGDGGVRSVQP